MTLLLNLCGRYRTKCEEEEKPLHGRGSRSGACGDRVPSHPFRWQPRSGVGLPPRRSAASLPTALPSLARLMKYGMLFTTIGIYKLRSSSFRFFRIHIVVRVTPIRCDRNEFVTHRCVGLGRALTKEVRTGLYE
ncbi:hypothetical protein J6590_009243 [Homalodisca vitripennis]|nr:hypothetical protein J6590_009243 [Homalodisca vitripennis]